MVNIYSPLLKAQYRVFLIMIFLWQSRQSYSTRKNKSNPIIHTMMVHKNEFYF